MSKTREDIETAYKKAVKALEGEKRAAIKKAKALKGKKGKDALAAVEDEYDGKAKALQTTLEQDLAALSLNDGDGNNNNGGIDGSNGKSQEKDGGDDGNGGTHISSDKYGCDDDEDHDDDQDFAARERKLAKARKKRERQREKEAEMERRIAEETANAGPSMRDVEMDQLQAILTPLNLAVRHIEADGHCMYRSIAAQLSLISTDNKQRDYKDIRELCADTLREHQDEFSPFCEYDDDVTNFDQYIDKVRNSAEWGGHLELRALRIALDRPILIYSLQNGNKPLEIHSDNGLSVDNDKDKEPIRLSYHLHYYALGEHYNQVVKTG